MFVEVFEEVGSAETSAVFLWQKEDGEGLRDVGFEPCGERGSGGLMARDQGTQASLGVGPGGRVEDRAQIGGELWAEGDFWTVMLGVLLEVESAALPRNASETGSECGTKAGVII